VKETDLGMVCTWPGIRVSTGAAFTNQSTITPVMRMMMWAFASWTRVWMNAFGMLIIAMSRSLSASTINVNRTDLVDTVGELDSSLVNVTSL